MLNRRTFMKFAGAACVALAFPAIAAPVEPRGETVILKYPAFNLGTDRIEIVERVYTFKGTPLPTVRLPMWGETGHYSHDLKDSGRVDRFGRRIFA